MCAYLRRSGKAKAKPNQNHCIAQRGGGRGCVVQSKRQNPSCWMFLKSPFAVFTVNGRDDRSVVFTVNVAVPPCRRGSTVYSCWTSNAPLSYGGLNKARCYPLKAEAFRDQDRKPLRGFYSSWADLYFSLKNIWVDVPLTPTGDTRLRGRFLAAEGQRKRCHRERDNTACRRLRLCAPLRRVNACVGTRCYRETRWRHTVMRSHGEPKAEPVRRTKSFHLCAPLPRQKTKQKTLGRCV